MAGITVRKLEDELKRRLRIRATDNGRSLTEEVRHIPRMELCPQPQKKNLASAIHARFAPLGGAELDIPPRSPMRQPPRFDWDNDGDCP